jgi:hypothetical protein
MKNMILVSILVLILSTNVAAATESFELTGEQACTCRPGSFFAEVEGGRPVIYKWTEKDSDVGCCQKIKVRECDYDETTQLESDGSMTCVDEQTSSSTQNQGIIDLIAFAVIGLGIFWVTYLLYPAEGILSKIKPSKGSIDWFLGRSAEENSGNGGAQEEAIKELKKRLARGEIDEDEYKNKKALLRD